MTARRLFVFWVQVPYNTNYQKLSKSSSYSGGTPSEQETAALARKVCSWAKLA
jgi:hypothetical protein